MPVVSFGIPLNLPILPRVTINAYGARLRVGDFVVRLDTHAGAGFEDFEKITRNIEGT
jgi:hypothetical protein